MGKTYRASYVEPWESDGKPSMRPVFNAINMLKTMAYGDLVMLGVKEFGQTLESRYAELLRLKLGYMFQRRFYLDNYPGGMPERVSVTTAQILAMTDVEFENAWFFPYAREDNSAPASPAASAQQGGSMAKTATKAAAKPATPREPRVTIKNTVFHGIEKGLTDAALIKLVAKKFPSSKFNESHAKWYRAAYGKANPKASKPAKPAKKSKKS